MGRGGDVVLVHGSWSGSWCWRRVRERLEADPRVGRVLALDLPGHGDRYALDAHRHRHLTLDDYAGDVVDALAARDLRRAVLVGHSMAGTFLHQVVAAAPARVSHALYVAALVPADGQSIHDLFVPLPGMRFTAPLANVAATARGIRRVLRPLSRLVTCHDLDPADALEVMDRSRPDPIAAHLQKVSWTGHRWTCDRTYVVCLRDRLVLPRRQRAMAARLGAGTRVVELDCGHNAPFARPADLAELIAYAAAAGARAAAG